MKKQTTKLKVLTMATLVHAACACAAETGPADRSGTPTDSIGGSPATVPTSSATSATSNSGGSGPSAVGGAPAVNPTGAPTTPNPPVGTPGSCAAVAATELLADFENGEAKVLEVGGRGSSFFLYNDGTGTQMPLKIVNTPLEAKAEGACSSAFGFRTWGSGFTGYGAGVGSDFVAKVAGQRAQYDATAYTGIAVRAKAVSPVSVRISVSDINTATEGGVCVNTTDPLNNQRCGDYFGQEVALTTEWKDYVLLFTSMAQRGWGMPIATGAAVAKVYTVRVQVPGDKALPPSFDFIIDDLRFVK